MNVRIHVCFRSRMLSANNKRWVEEKLVVPLEFFIPIERILHVFFSSLQIVLIHALQFLSLKCLRTEVFFYDRSNHTIRNFQINESILGCKVEGSKNNRNWLFIPESQCSFWSQARVLIIRGCPSYCLASCYLLCHSVPNLYHSHPRISTTSPVTALPNQVARVAGAGEGRGEKKAKGRGSPSSSLPNSDCLFKETLCSNTLYI